MKIQLSSGAIAALAIVAATFVSCDKAPTDPHAAEADPPSVEVPGDSLSWALLNCTGTLTEPALSCTPPAGVDDDATDGLSRLIVGNQGVNVLLESSDVSYDAGTQRFTFDVTLRNLLPQPLATTDGVTLHPDGARIFFHGDPVVTIGSGSITVEADGAETFTAATQPFYQYDEIIGTDETSAPRGWTLVMPPTVEEFTFQVFVFAEVPFPNGFVDLGVDSLFLQSGDTLRLSPVVLSAMGEPLSTEDPVVFTTGDSTVVAVDEEGLITAMGTGAAVVTASSGPLSGQVVVTIVTASRRWTGAVSSDWAEPGNWYGGFVPESGDSVHIPIVAADHHPAVLASAVTVGHLTVDKDAILDLAEFDLTVTGDLRTSTTGGIQSTTGHLVLSGTDGVIEGVLPRTRITGSYSLAAATEIAGPLMLQGGKLSGAGQLLRVSAGY